MRVYARVGPGGTRTNAEVPVETKNVPARIVRISQIVQLFPRKRNILKSSFLFDVCFFSESAAYFFAHSSQFFRESNQIFRSTVRERLRPGFLQPRPCLE